MVKVNLKDAYFSIPINPAHHPFLSFQHKAVTYQFNCLPFRLSSVPRIFTKISRSVAAWLRQLGCRMINYIDNNLLRCNDCIHACNYYYWLDNFVNNCSVHPVQFFFGWEDIKFCETSKDPEWSIYLDMEEFPYMVHRAGSSIIQLWTRWIGCIRQRKLALATDHWGPTSVIIRAWPPALFWSSYTISRGIGVSWWY